MAETAPSLKLTSEGALKLLQAAIAKAKEMNVPQCISIVDTGGHLLAFARMDGAFVLSVDTSLAKAKTAASHGVPTGIGVPAPNDILAPSNGDAISFIKRQRALIERLYQNGQADDLTPEEEIIADLIGNERGENSGLQSFVRNFLAIIEFDAHRRGRLISQQELTWYSDRLGKAVDRCGSIHSRKRRRASSSNWAW